MDLSIFLAKLLGLYMLIIAGAWLVSKEKLDESFKDLASSKGLIVFSGMINIALGLAIAIGHPIWQLNWVGLITLIGYLMIFKGVIRLLFTEKVQRDLSAMLTKGYWPIMALLIILGGILTYSGFMIG